MLIRGSNGITRRSRYFNWQSSCQNLAHFIGRNLLMVCRCPTLCRNVGLVNHRRSPHPYRPGQICLTRELIGARVYRLPEGLAPGVRVKTVAYDHGYWQIYELEVPERTWTVYIILLEVADKLSAES